MKVSLLGLSLSLLAGTMLQAQINNSFLVDSPRSDREQQRQQQMLNISQPPVALSPSAKSAESTQALTYTGMYATDFYASWEISENRTFLYDPTTNAVMLFRPMRVFNNTSLSGGELRAYVTTNEGSSWLETQIANTPNRFLTFPNVSVVNPFNSATTVSDLNWIIFSASFEPSGETWRRNGAFSLIKAGTDLIEFPMQAPENAPSDMGWNVNGDMAQSNNPSPASYYVDRSDKFNEDGPSQYGMYGTWGFDYEVSDFTANQIPNEWNVNQFQQVSPPNKNSTLNGSPRIGTDNEGNLYMVVANILASEADIRTPMVSTSTDQGASWSAFTKMPSQLLLDYQSAHGFGSIVVFRPYDDHSLVVTGKDQFSYFFRLADYGASGNQLTSIHLVEAKYDNGAWSLNMIADLNGIPVEFVREDTISGPTGWVPYYSAANRGHEIEVAITADGQNLLIKWIDENPAFIDSGFTQTVRYRTANNTWATADLTAFTATDVYFSYRAVNGGSWSTPVNITNDRLYDHGTKLPAVIKNLTSVPLVVLRGLRKSDVNPSSTFGPALLALPEMILNAHIDYRTPNLVQTAFFNALNPSSVSESMNYPFSVHAVSPNPANAEAEFTFTMDVASNTTISVYSSTGELVHTAYSGALDAGLHGITINTSNLASGTYYVALSVGTQRVSKPLVVIR